MASTEDLMTKAADILVVDDDITSLRLLTEILDEEGYQVRSVEQSQLGLDSALAQPPSLILLDVKMPEISGFEVCQRLKQDERTREVPIIFVSALQELQDRIQGFEVGGVDFILKPIHESEVLARVKTHLQLRDTQLHLEELVAERTAELEKANDELRTSENRYRSVVEDSPLLICNSEPGGIITFVNNAYCTYFGKDQQELIGKSFFSLIPYEDRDWVAADISGLTPEAPIQVHEHRDLGLDDQIRWQRWTDRALFDEDGRVTSYQSFGEDITERKQAEEALRESEEKYRTMIEYSNVMVWMLDKKGNFTYINKNSEELTGYKFEEEIGKGFIPIILEEDLEMVQDVFRRILQGEHLSYEVRIHHASRKKLMTLSVNSAPIYKDKEITGIVSFGRDISEQREMDEAIIESRERYRALSEASFEAIFISEKGVCIEQNATAGNMFGYTSSEAVGRKGTDWIVPDDREMVMNNMVSGYEEPYEALALRKDGSTFPAEIQARMMSYKGRAVRVTALNDISERKHAAEMLRGSEDKYRSLIEQALDGIVVVQDGVVKFINPSVSTMIGQEPEEILEKEFVSFIAPDERANITEMYRKRMNNEPVPSVYESATVDKDGTRVEIEINAGLTMYEGRIADQVIVRDITQRKLIENQLRENEEKLAGIVSSISDPMNMLDVDHNIVWANDVSKQIFGTDIEGTKCYTSFHQREKPCEECVVNKSFADGQIHERTTEVIDQDGRMRIFMGTSNVASYDEDGKPSLVVEVSHDITESRKAENTLRESEERFRATFEQAAVGIDHGTLDGRFLRINQKFCDIVGYSKEEMLERTFQDITHPDDLDIDLENAQRLLDGQLESYSTEKRYLRKNGEIVWVNITVSLVRDNTGSPSYFISVVEDITRRVLADQQLNVYQKDLEVLLQERSEALSSAEDQIKTLFESVQLGIGLSNLEGDILVANPALTRMMGYSDTEILQINVSTIYDDPAQRTMMLQQLQAEKFVRDFGVRLKRKDGTVFLARLNVSPIRSEGKDSLLAIIEDVTEEMQAEVTLKASEKLLRILADNYPAYLSIINKGEQDLVVDFSSGRELEKQNLDPSSFNGKMLGEIFGDHAAFVRENYERAFMGEEVTFELFINDQYQLYRAIPLYNEENEGIDRILVVVDVIDDRKLLEAKIKETAAREERDRLARNLHDAVTQTIFSASAIAEATPRIWEKDEALGRQYLERLPVMLRGALAEMRTLLLEFRPEALKEQTLDQLLDTLVGAARANTRAKVTLMIERNRPLPEDVTISLYRITQECLNNIIKHSAASQIDVGLCFNRDGVELNVSDNGCGFDPESIQPEHLGLGIMRDRAQEIGAKFKIDSEPDGGTVVSVTWSDQARPIL